MCEYDGVVGIVQCEQFWLVQEVDVGCGYCMVVDGDFECGCMFLQFVFVYGLQVDCCLFV